MSSEAAAYLSNALSDATEVALPVSASQAAARPTNKSSAETSAIGNISRESSDDDLLFQVSEGNRESLSILFRRHAQSVFNVAHRILHDNAEAEDLLQELFLFIFQKAQLFDSGKGSAVSWIIQMAYHRAIDRRRYLNSRHHYNVQEFNEEQHHVTHGQISIDEVAGRALLNRLREELSPEQRQTLELHFFEGYTFNEIAERTGQGFGNVRHHYYRGLERLRSFVFPGKAHPK